MCTISIILIELSSSLSLVYKSKAPKTVTTAGVVKCIARGDANTPPTSESGTSVAQAPAEAAAADSKSEPKSYMNGETPRRHRAREVQHRVDRRSSKHMHAFVCVMLSAFSRHSTGTIWYLLAG